MDRKTLEYMEGRAKKARSIVDQIESLIKGIDRVKSTCGIEFHVLKKSNVRIGTWDDKQIADVFSAQLVAAVVNVFIDQCLKEIQRLEQELAEL